MNVDVRFFIYSLALLHLVIAPLHAAEEDSQEHLRGLNFLHMQIDASLDQEVSAMQRLDLSDILELQLRRREIDIRPIILNRPDLSVPTLVLSIDTSDRLKTGEFELVLQVRDRVIIKRNRNEVVATTYELRRSGRAESNEVATIKAVLRDLTADFAEIYRQQNPLLSETGEKE